MRPGPELGHWPFMIEQCLDRPVLKIRRTKCRDCPAYDMYSEIIEDLQKEPLEIRKAVSEKWFCHTTRNLGCRGNWEQQKLDLDTPS